MAITRPPEGPSTAIAARPSLHRRGLTRYPQHMPDVATAYSARAAEYADALGSMDAVHPSDR